LLITSIVGAVLLVAGGVVAYLLVARANSDEAKIQRLVQDFAVAIDYADQEKVLSLLCTEEADRIREDDDFHPRDTAGPAPEDATAEVTISDLRVTGDTASARITRPSRPAATLHFTKEGGEWKVCDPGDPTVPTTTPTPR
jgi:hypothetical protein